MNPERWQQVTDILHRAMSLQDQDRVAYLAELALRDPELHREVVSLLASHQEAGSEFLNTPAVQAGLDQNETTQRDPMIGRRLGPYQIVELIGCGGMGEVYRAVRADDQYRKQVALKLVRAGQDSAAVINRFKNERQILASLDHPNIARLLDGGTTEEGVPYFVMELIEGQTIERYCDDHNLTTSERLTLFLQVCSAVQLAHQRLIVHRDLKPGNILVTADGVPRLLDFGIAKLLDPGVAAEIVEPTLTQFRVFTPGYASPEQIKGEPITTASDVYSLGVVLYELLTGVSPYGSTSRTPHEVAQAVCELEPEKPSTAIRRRTHGSQTGGPPVAVNSDTNRLSRSLKGDLDNIVLMALRKEPQRRYSSVEQFAQDIRRHLENLPVIARKDTSGYRTVKFVTRHKAGVAATAVSAIVLLAALFVTIREARIARQQAELAREQRARAEQRFNDVRKLANSLIFEIHDSIQDLPGATPARKLLVDRAVQYLDSLAKESNGDPALQRDLGLAYHRLGIVQGSPHSGNLGDTEAAKASIRKAAALFESAAKANPNNVIDQLNNAFGHRLLVFVSSAGGADRQQIDQAMAITERLMKLDAANPKVRNERAIEFEVLAGVQDTSGDRSGALESMRNSLRLKQDVATTNPDYPGIRRGVALSTVKVSDELGCLGSRKEALETNQSGIELYEFLSKGKSDARSTRELAVTRTKRGDIELMNGDAAGALRSYRQCLSVVEPMAKADPQNSMLRLDVGGSLLSEGKALESAGNHTEALVMLKKSVPILEAEHHGDPANTDIPHLLAMAYVWQGQALSRDGKARAALENARKAIAILEGSSDLTAANTQGELASSYANLADALRKIGNLQEAKAAYQKALTIIQPFVSANNPPALYVSADANSGMGDVARAMAAHSTPDKQPQYWAEARDWYRKSQDAWRQISNPGAVSPSGFPCGNPREVTNAIAICDSALRGR